MAPVKKYETIEEAKEAKRARARAYKAKKRLEQGDAPRPVGRPRIHASDADRRKAYTERQKQKTEEISPA